MVPCLVGQEQEVLEPMTHAHLAATNAGISITMGHGLCIWVCLKIVYP